MMSQPSLPSLERVQQRAIKVQAICRQADEEILILDKLIAQVEAENRASRLNVYPLNQAKPLLN